MSSVFSSFLNFLTERECEERIQRYQDKYKEISDITGISQDTKRMTLTNGGTGVKIKENSTDKIFPIKDSSINNVKRVEIDGFNDTQNDYIHNQHKELLKYARDNNESKDVFRKDLSDKTVFDGSEHSVEFESGLFGKGDGLFVMHNHPSNSSFSKTDIDEFVNNNSIGKLSVVKNNGNVEIITKTEKYVQRNAFIYKERYKKKIAPNKTDAEYDKMVSKYLLYCENEGLIKWIK